MMKKLLALLLCLSLTFCATIASAAAPTGWKAHTAPAIGLKAWLPADFRANSSIPDKDLRAMVKEYTANAPGALCVYSPDRSSVLCIFPNDEDSEIVDGFVLDMIWLFKSFLIDGMDFPVDDIFVRKAPDKDHRYLCVTIIPEGYECMACLYTPQFEGARYQLAYISSDGKITTDEFDMLDTILINLEYTGK